MIRLRSGLWAAMAASALLLQAQPVSPKLAPGRILVATEECHDPDFAQSVILLVDYQEQGGVLGLMINRRTKVELARLFPELPSSAKNRTDAVYAGGPVTLSVIGLERSRAKVEKADLVFGEVYSITDKDVLEQTASSGKPPDSFRVYVGYAGWTGPQLRGEVDRGFWHVVHGDANLIFDPHPETIWDRLNRRTQPLARAWRDVAGPMRAELR